ncbi:MAG TPA: HEAT repeat domain-containing protein [Longimicrobium sp.]|jgi:hypothetical protein
MDDLQLLRVALRVLAALFVAALAFIAAHGVWLLLRRRWRAARLAEGRAVMAGVATAPALEPQAVRRLRALPPNIQSQLLVELTRNLGGSVRERVGVLARELGLLDHARRLSRSRFWWRRLRGLRLLTAFGGDEAEAVLPHFHDSHPAVRAQAAEWAGDHPSPAAVRALLEMLADPATLCRFAVQDSILRVGLAAAEPLAEHLARSSGCAAAPALEVAAALAQPEFAEPALRLCGDPDPEVRAQAAAVVGAVQAPECAVVLAGLLADPDARVRATAAAALGRIGHWPAAPAVAKLLRDPAFPVRRAAGLALRGLGSPGMLLLGRYRADTDPFAADMARQVLDLPDTAPGAA